MTSGVQEKILQEMLVVEQEEFGQVQQMSKFFVKYNHHISLHNRDHENFNHPKLEMVFAVVRLMLQTF